MGYRVRQPAQITSLTIWEHLQGAGCHGNYLAAGNSFTDV